MNIARDDRVIYTGKNGKPLAVKVVCDYYIPPSAVHYFRTQDIITGKLYNVMAKDMYASAIVFKENTNKERIELSKDKKRRNKKARKV